MGIRTRADYETSLRDERAVYYQGERVVDVTTHPVISKAVHHAGLSYELAEDPRNQLRCVADADGEKVSRFFLPPETSEDLRRRVELVDFVTRRGATMPTTIHEIGTDAIFALLSVAAEMGGPGEEYQRRARAFWKQAMREDLAMAVAQTDVKGDRSLRPSQQPDPDLYVRTKERRSEGIVIRGAKAHTSMAVCANEIIVLPTRALGNDEEPYAVAFAIPADTEGLTMVVSPFLDMSGPPEEYPVSSTRRMSEAITIFDDVLVPWERVFLCGETDWAGRLALRFVEFHRLTGVIYKLSLTQALIGAALLAAEQSGISEASHVRSKLIDLITWVEAIDGLVTAAITRSEAVPGGLRKANTLLINVAKSYFAHSYHTMIRHVQDIGGGLVVTSPSWKDVQSPEVGAVLQRYLVGRSGTPTVDRLKTLNLMKDLTASEYGGLQQVLAVHAEGSLEAERLQVLRAAPLDRYRALARRLAGLAAADEEG